MNIYLDNAATTRLDPRVFADMKAYFSDKYANASSIHLPGQAAYLDLMSAKDRIAKRLHGRPESVIFTSGATEANNLIIKGVVLASQDAKRRKVIVSAIEHPCVLESARELAAAGFQIEYIQPDSDGIIQPEALKKMVDKQTILVSVMAVNNEIGTIQDVAALAAIAHDNGAYFHTDATQAVPYLEFDVEKMGIDLLSFSAHKIYGPKGVGAAYISKGIKLRPLIVGGGQEDGYRAGTYNLPGIMGFASAFELAYKERKSYLKKVKALRDRLWKGIQKGIPDARLNGSWEKRIPANLNVMFSYVEGEAILIDLSYKGIQVSTGSACSASNLKASPVLKAIGLNKNFLNSNIRFSLGRFNTEKEIDKAISALKTTVARLRQFSPIKN